MTHRVYVKDCGFGTVVPCGDPNYTFIDLDDGTGIAVRNGDEKRRFVTLDEPGTDDTSNRS